jgi:hypothetical protein
MYGADAESILEANRNGSFEKYIEESFPNVAMRP